MSLLICRREVVRAIKGVVLLVIFKQAVGSTAWVRQRQQGIKTEHPACLYTTANVTQVLSSASSMAIKVSVACSSTLGGKIAQNLLPSGNGDVRPGRDPLPCQIQQ